MSGTPKVESSIMATGIFKYRTAVRPAESRPFKKIVG